MICALKKASRLLGQNATVPEIIEEFDVHVIRAGHSDQRRNTLRRARSGTLCRWIFVVTVLVFGQPEIFSQQQAAQSLSQNQATALSPEQRAALEQLLAGWEARNEKVTTWSCTFYKWEQHKCLLFL